MTTWGAALYLEKGELFEGLGFGAPIASGGEVIFNTGMTGYQEMFTDPSYYKQIVLMGYPHIGNTGINEEDNESARLYLSAVVTREYVPCPSNWRSKRSLGDYLAAARVPGISEVDTREITEMLRDGGSQRGVVFPTENAIDALSYGKQLLEKVETMEGLELVSQVSVKAPYCFELGKAKEKCVVVYDYGVKTNILRKLQESFKVWVVPYNMPAEEVMAYRPCGVILSNGPGDPACVPNAVDEIQKLLGKVPILAICMGHQLLARALGAKTYKLKFGHHGVNHPVKDLKSGRVLITSQNHGFAVRKEDLKQRELELSHVNLNDQTVEGFFSDSLKILSLQFHPEASPGPRDAHYLFDRFIRGFIQ